MKPNDATAQSTQEIAHTIFTPPNEAVAEIKRRRKDTTLVKKVEDFLGTVPEHFNQKDPILYLARHVATPNFETLRFIEIAQQFDLPIVIGEDHDDKFVSNNSLKRALGKLPVMKGTARNGDEIIEHMTIVDFDKAQGLPFREIETTFNQNLPFFHSKLMNEIYPQKLSIIDESKWVNIHRNKSLVEQYKIMFALLVTHGIMFEWYPPQEASLVTQTVIPAFTFIQNTFGVKPLICELVPAHMSYEKNWESYPSVLYAYIKKELDYTN